MSTMTININATPKMDPTIINIIFQLSKGVSLFDKQFGCLMKIIERV